MTAAVARVGDSLHVGRRLARLLVLVGLCGLAVVVAQLTRMGMLTSAIAGVVGVLFVLASLRWPLLPLAVFVALIPIEQVLVIDGIGTLSKLAGALFAVSYAAPRLGRLTLGVMPFPGWAFLAFAVLSVGWAIDPAIAWGELSTLIQMFIIAVLIADVVVQRSDLVRPIMWIYSISAAATAIIGIQSYVALGSAADRAAALQDQNPAQFAAILLPALVFSFYEMMQGDRRILAAGIALLTTLGVVVSGTRGAWVGVAVVVLLFVLPRFAWRQRILAVATILALVVVVYQLPGVAGLVQDRTDTALTTGGAGRTDIWMVGLKIYESAPILGVGFANFPVAYTPEAIQAADITWRSAAFVGRGPHNLVVGTLAELGPLGMLLLALFLGPLVFRRGWGPDAAMIQAALASLLVTALFLDILSNRKQVWLIIGIAAGLSYLRRTMPSPTRDGARLDSAPG